MVLSSRFRDFGRRLLLAAASELEPELKQVMRGWMLKKLEKVTPDMLVDAIETGYDVWNVAPSEDKKFGLALAKKAQHIYFKYEKAINVDLVMEWLKRDRGDLYDVLHYYPTSRAREWLGRNIERLKESMRGGMR